MEWLKYKECKHDIRVVIVSTLSSISSLQSELHKINEFLMSILTRMDNLEGKQLHNPKPTRIKKRKYVASDKGTDPSDSLMNDVDQLGEYHYYHY